MMLDTFKDRFETAAFFLVYVGYLLQLFIFTPQYDKFFLIHLGAFIVSIIMMARAFFSYPIIILHHILYLIYIDVIVGNENYYLAISINTIFFLSFYILIIYPIINLFIDLDSKIKKLLKEK